MSNERLQELRGQVDVINMQILELLSKRASIVTEIGKLHTSMGNEHYDPEREAHMLQALEQANKGPFSNETIKALFREIFRASRRWCEERYAKLLHHKVLSKGGHFAAFEQPEVFVNELRNCFRSLR